MANETTETPIPDELVITLRKPITWAGITHDKLVLREPTAGEWMEWDKLTGSEADIKCVATVAAVPEPVIRMIGLRDLIKASRYLARFLN